MLNSFTCMWQLNGPEHDFSTLACCIFVTRPVTPSEPPAENLASHLASPVATHSSRIAPLAARCRRDEYYDHCTYHYLYQCHYHYDH